MYYGDYMKDIFLDKLNQIKNEEVIDELVKVNKYKIYLIENNKSNHEIDKFIDDIMEKYSNESIVSEYYSEDNYDFSLHNKYYYLGMIENMIIKYVTRTIHISNINASEVLYLKK